MQNQSTTPIDVARELGIAASTLRLYSVRFAAFLSASAAQPAALGPRRPGYRRYTRDDVALLARAKAMLGEGLSYAQVAERLSRPPGVVGAGATSVGGDTAALREMVEAWRQLAEERRHEIERLREDIVSLRQELKYLRDFAARPGES